MKTASQQLSNTFVVSVLITLVVWLIFLARHSNDDQVEDSPRPAHDAASAYRIAPQAGTVGCVKPEHLDRLHDRLTRGDNVSARLLFDSYVDFDMCRTIEQADDIQLVEWQWDKVVVTVAGDTGRWWVMGSALERKE